MVSMNFVVFFFSTTFRANFHFFRELLNQSNENQHISKNKRNLPQSQDLSAAGNANAQLNNANAKNINWFIINVDVAIELDEMNLNWTELVLTLSRNRTSQFEILNNEMYYDDALNSEFIWIFNKNITPILFVAQYYLAEEIWLIRICKQIRNDIPTVSAPNAVQCVMIRN